MNNILGGSTMVNETGTSSNIENYKIAIIGNQHVGKTTILSRYKYETTDDTYAPTVGIDFLTKNVFLEDKTIRLVMWDTAGQERFKSLIPSYLKNANCVILTYDITDKSSFTSLNKWLSDVRDNVVEGTFIILCGNKIDLNNKRAVPKEDGEKFAQENKIAYAETSATTGEGINELFNTIIGNFCDVPIINKEEKDDDDLDNMGSKSIALKDLKKEDVKIEQQKKKNNCCGGGGKKEKKKGKGK
jgi:small GTP-binding protein